MTTPWATPGCRVRLRPSVDWYGPVDLATMDSNRRPPSRWLPEQLAASHTGELSEGTWLGGALNTPAVSTKLSQANLISYLATAKTLPFFIIAQGDDDCQVPWASRKNSTDALAKVGNTANLNIIPGYSHGDSRFETTQSAPDLTLLVALFGR